jgi:prophage regulatory protein
MMKVLSFSELKSKKGIRWSRVHVDRQEKAGKFPKRIHLGPSTVVWSEEEIDAMLRERMEEREGTLAEQLTTTALTTPSKAAEQETGVPQKKSAGSTGLSSETIRKARAVIEAAEVERDEKLAG